MGIGSKLSKLMDMNDTNANELARKIDVSPQTIYSIIKRDSKKADIEVLLKLADTLGVTAEYFVDDINVGNESGLEQYSKEELTHLKKYHDLDPIGQSHVDAVLQWETERVQQIEQAASTVVEVADSDSQGRILQYFHSVSAGAGEVLFDDVCTERITVPDRPQYRRVAYAVKVSGHSMEPLYHDKDILLVEPTCEISVGEIGIFNVNGQAYVKKLGKGKLISLNKGYDDIPLTEESLCMGRVVDSLKP
jgi:phage repressor protein C with HTH and peptisase S24 domain/DNA-binding XRE family transcriptional regulator